MLQCAHAIAGLYIDQVYQTPLYKNAHVISKLVRFPNIEGILLPLNSPSDFLVFFCYMAAQVFYRINVPDNLYDLISSTDL